MDKVQTESEDDPKLLAGKTTTTKKHCVALTHKELKSALTDGKEET